MAVIFPRWTNLLPLAAAVGAPVGLVGAVLGAWYFFSPEFTDVGYRPKQPVPFSHQTHAGDLGLDCRYCHSTVELAAHAAVPPTQTCMNCHGVVKKDSPNLAAVFESWKTGDPIQWQRVHLLPDYAFFNHSAHVAAGVGCQTCHGRIDQMPVVQQEKPLSMGWCLECHRDPWPNLRPRAEVTSMTWQPAGYDPHADPSRKRAPTPPTACSGCHR